MSGYNTAVEEAEMHKPSILSLSIRQFILIRPSVTLQPGQISSINICNALYMYRCFRVDKHPTSVNAIIAALTFVGLQGAT